MAQQQISVSEAAKRIRAGEQLGTVLGMSQTQIKAFAALAYNSYTQGKFKDAETLFKGVIAFDNKSYVGYAGVGAVALAQKPPDLEKAYTYLSKAAELNPDDATIQANLGEVLLRGGKIDDARKHLERAFQLDPDRKDAGANRARALVHGLDVMVKEAERRQAHVKRAKAS